MKNTRNLGPGRLPLALVMASALGVARPAAANSTIVQFDTTLGDIDVRLMDTATPASVANFLNYVTDGDYDGSFFHRAPLTRRVNSAGELVDANGDPLPLDINGDPILTDSVIDTFVVQGGGFTFSNNAGLGNVSTDPAVINEPGLTNLPGTIAYAKQGGDPNSATSGFFFNTTNNVANLDNQNGGFTVFARVVRGQSALDAITALQLADLDGPSQFTFDNVPVIEPTPDLDGLEDNLVFINSVSILSLPAADYNFDGVVDNADFTVWQSLNGASLRIVDHTGGATPSTLMDADGNGDGVVDAADYQLWRDEAGVVDGDLNGDGQLTNADISAFVLSLTDPQAYAAANPDLIPDALGDFTGDGSLTNADISGFVDALTGGGSAASEVASAIQVQVPEPTSLTLLALGGLLAVRRRR